MLGRDDVLASRDREDHVRFLARLAHRQDAVASKRGLQGRDGVDLGDQHLGAHTARPQRHAGAAVAEPGDDDGFPGHQDVHPLDCGEHALAGSQLVVELVLAAGIVDGEERHLQGTCFLHRVEPLHSGRGLFLAGQDGPVLDELGEFLVRGDDQVGAVIDQDVRAEFQALSDAPVELVGRVPVPGKDLDAHVGQRCS